MVCLNLKNYDRPTSKQMEVIMDKPFYLGFVILELSRLHMYETFYDKLPPSFGHHKYQLHYMDCDSFVLSNKTQIIVIISKNFEDLVDFSNLNKNHKIFSNKNKKLNGKFEFETPKTIWIDEIIALRRIMYAFICGEDSKKNLKGLCEVYSKTSTFEEYKKRLCGKYIKKSVKIIS